LLHLLILWLSLSKIDEIKFPPPKKQEKQIHLSITHIVTPPPAPRPNPIPKPVISPPVPVPKKPIIEKKVELPVPEVEEVKRTILDESKKTFAAKSTEENNVTKIVQKPVKKVMKKKVIKKPKKKIVKKKVTKKKHVVKRKPKKHRVKRSKNSLTSFLMSAGTSLNSKKTRHSTSAFAENMIKKLYGSEFNTYSPEQKKYIRNNLGTIYQITQQTLLRNGYPTVAIQTQQQGTNVVSFYLHPNGDITGLKLKRYIGYEALDNNTLTVIRLAYKDYPLPNQKTKITFYVQYSMY
jgi:TonB family protein